VLKDLRIESVSYPADADALIALLQPAPAQP
jgi:hypothetical protein